MFITAVIIYFITLVVGILGVIVPALPGIPLMFLSTLLFNLYLHKFDLSSLIILGLICLISIVIDYASGIFISKYFGASSKALYAGFLGFLLGTFLLPPLGGLIGLFAGILVGELIAGHEHRKAVKAATGGLLGTLTGIVANLALGLTFLILAIIYIF